jgi:hypothetical protein
LFTDASKAFLPIAGLALVGAFLYAAASSDDAGVTLLFFVVIAAATVGVTLLRYRENEVAPPIAADAPVADPRPVRVESAPAGGGWALLGAAATGLALSGFVLGPAASLGGGALGVMAIGGWAVSLSGERTGRRLDLLPLALPMMGFFAIGTMIFFMSRILLAVPSANAATVIAIAVATLVLAGGALVASKPNLPSGAIVTALGVVGVLFLTGGLVAMGFGERKAEGGGFAGPVSIRAHNLRFDKNELDFRAESPGILHFVNADTDPHNVAIYKSDKLGTPLFSFAPIPGPTVQDFQIRRTPAAGTYFFRCDVHPQQMFGKVVVKAATEKA